MIFTGKAESEKEGGTEDNGWINQLNRTTLANDWNLTIEQIGSDQHIWEVIQSSKALAVLDGSFQEQCGACAWIIKGENNTDHIISTMTVPGSEGDHSSFRSKAAGLYRLLLTVQYMVKDNPIQGSLTVAYDGKLVLDRLQSRKTIDLFAAHADLLQACKHILTQIQCQVEFQHIKCHQDKGQPTVLQCDVWLNIEVDLRAKASIETEYMVKATKILPMEPLVLTISN